MFNKGEGELFVETNVVVLTFWHRNYFFNFNTACI